MNCFARIQYPERGFRKLSALDQYAIAATESVALCGVMRS
jgi:hypothetical protein